MAQFFEHDGAVGGAELRPAELFRQHHAEPAKLGSFLDQLRLKRLFVLVQLRHLVRRHFGLDEIGGDFFQHLLVFSQT
jgi:hypothetical protein